MRKHFGHLSLLNFLPLHTRWKLLHQLAAGTPNLDQVVLGSAGHYPRIVPVPGEVADTVGVATVHEKHLGRTVLGVLRRLLATSLANVPEDCTAIFGRRCENSRLVWVPVDLVDDILVAFERVDAATSRETEIEEANRLISRSSSKQLIHGRVEGKRVDGVGVCVLEKNGRFRIALRAKVHDLDSEIIGDGTKEVLAVQRVVLNVIDGGTVVGELAGRLKGLVLEREVTGKVPQVDHLVLASREELTFSVRVPFECEALTSVSS